MINKIYDLIIVGGGPIGSVAAYFISQEKDNFKFQNIALIQKEPEVSENIAYLNAGGSIRWYFEDEEIRTATKKTYDFILKIKDKINLNLVEDNYFFIHKGVFVPSVNISGKKLVDYFKENAQQKGIEIFSGFDFINFKKDSNNYLIKTNKTDFLTKRIIFALGYKNKEYFNLPLEIEKRQLFVLNMPITKEKEKLPHTVLKLKNGVIYFFIKKFDDGYKLVLGQEDIFEHSLKLEPEDYFNELLSEELLEILPFLKNSKVEKILWGFDVKNKKPYIQEIEKNVWTFNCGSAVRSIIYIGEKILEVLKPSMT